MMDAIDRLRLLPRPMVLTNGVFDLLHRGHVSHLRLARCLGQSLVVAINSDASARRLGKGPGRPFNTEADRAYLVGALDCVSATVVFEEPNPLALIRQLRPDIYVKGGDYDIETMAEAELVRSWGGKAIALDFEHGYSTSEQVDAILAANQRETVFRLIA